MGRANQEHVAWALAKAVNARLWLKVHQIFVMQHGHANVCTHVGNTGAQLHFGVDAVSGGIVAYRYICM